ncbi:uncharacterized protein LOC129599885 [Paramacrobiotus metropolitanus]|uniref:uncharacterized protein LOC129599885 n=1 Tax=Paramacrobiotus metropolitanus TaxID=2943436 RepID=UPI00244573D4|nr:uncharacterized protein LOC129599885 [Paramacrobiotus metropolitanus]
MRYIILAACFLSVVVSAQKCTEKRFPYLMSTFADAKPETSGGIWYRYRSLDASKKPVTNVRVNVTLIGPTTTPLTNDPAQAYWTTTAYKTNDGKCHADYYMAMYSNSGRKVGYGLSADDDYLIHPQNLALVYTDNKELTIEYGCFKKNNKDVVASTCDQPVIHVDTRIKPEDLTAQKQADFDKLIDVMFSLNCIKATDIPKVEYKPEAFCDFTPAPDCTTRMVKGLAEITVKPSAKKVTAATNSKCKWPLVIPGEKKHEPKKVVGQWHIYRKLYADEPDSVNQMYNVNNIGLGELPLSAIAAQWQWIQYSQYNGEKDTTCRNGFWTGAVGANGAQIGFDVMTTGEPMPVLNNMNGLYYDDNFALDYGCIVPNTKTSVCEKPFVYASTRTRPTKLSQADKDKFDKIIDGFLSKYGCSVKDVPQIKFIDSKPACKFAEPTACIAKAVQGLKQATSA